MMARNLKKLTARVGWLKRERFYALAAVFALVSPNALLAQSQPASTASAAVVAVPTTKLLAIGTFTAKATPDVWGPFIPAEVRDTVRLYLAGKIDQWYVKQDQSGVVFLMNLTDPKEARELLGKLPLGQAGLMEFQIIELGPIGPLRVLLAEPQK